MSLFMCINTNLLIINKFLPNSFCGVPAYTSFACAKWIEWWSEVWKTTQNVSIFRQLIQCIEVIQDELTKCHVIHFRTSLGIVLEMN